MVYKLSYGIMGLSGGIRKLKIKNTEDDMLEKIKGFIVIVLIMAAVLLALRIAFNVDDPTHKQACQAIAEMK